MSKHNPFRWRKVSDDEYLLRDEKNKIGHAVRDDGIWFGAIHSDWGSLCSMYLREIARKVDALNKKEAGR